MIQSRLAVKKFFYLTCSLVLVGVFTLISGASVHAAALHTKAPHISIPAGCTDVTRFQGTNTDSTGIYTVYLEVHEVEDIGCYSLYTVTQAYVAEGYSYNIRICTGATPESLHTAEVCHDYSGYAPLHGWSSPLFRSYNWAGHTCDGYADIIGHVSIASHLGC